MEDNINLIIAIISLTIVIINFLNLVLKKKGEIILYIDNNGTSKSKGLTFIIRFILFSVTIATSYLSIIIFLSTVISKSSFYDALLSSTLFEIGLILLISEKIIKKNEEQIIDEIITIAFSISLVIFIVLLIAYFREIIIKIAS